MSSVKEKRLIEYYAVAYQINKLQLGAFRELDKTSCRAYGKALDVLSDAPTVDAEEVVHGRWIFEQAYENGTADYKCSICEFDDSFPIGNFTYRNYCPNCGAKMDGDGDA